MEVRKAVLTDAKGIAKVHVDSWLSTYRGIIPDEFLDKLTYESREQLWEENISRGNVFVAESKGRIVGFSSGGKERSGKYQGFDGELRAIYLLEEYQGKGIGKLLVDPIIAELRRLTIYSMLVLVLKDNHSRMFYEALGGTIIDTVEIEIAGKKLKELVYGWEDIRDI
jgi:GNAT superfamily N-acetyltransferase